MENVYPRQKLWEAVYCLVGDGTVQTRLAGAALHLTALKPSDFPDELGERFSALYFSLTNREGDALGAIAATTERLSDDEAVKLAHEILSLYTAVRGGI